MEEIKSVCGEIFTRATEPIVVAPPEFVMEVEVAIPVAVRERVTLHNEFQYAIGVAACRGAINSSEQWNLL